MNLAWGAKVSPVFRRLVIELGASLGCDPSWLMACMYFESRLNPAAKNPNSSATGLIQFMAATAEALGTTTEALAAMSAEAQLEWVARYFEPYAGRIKSIEDTYMAILWPRAVGQPNDAVLFADGTNAYLQNRGLDLDRDKAVTKAEAAAFAVKALAEGMLPKNVYQDDVATAVPDVTPPDVTPPVTQPTERKPMGAGLLLGLVQSIVQGFAPLAKEKLTAALGQHEPGSDAGTAIINAVMGAAMQATGKTDPIEAAVAVKADPVATKAVETASLSQLDSLAPILDKLASLDKDVWTAGIAGRNAASLRAQSDKYDLAPLLAKSNLAMIGGIVALLLIALCIQVIMTPSHEPSAALIGMIGPLVAILFGNTKEMFAYRFDGTPRSNAAEAMRDAIQAKGSP